MGRPSKLTDKQRDAVIAKVTSGWSYVKVAGWLEKSHGIKITPQSLNELVKRHRSELADASKAVGRAVTAKTVEGAMKALSIRLARARDIVRQCERAAMRIGAGRHAIESHARAVASFARLHELVQKASGLDQPDTPSFDGLVELLGLALAEREDQRSAERARAVAGSADPVGDES